MADINEQVTDEWVDATTARDRVKEILEETTEYSTASDIAAQARTSEPTARKYLNEFVTDGLGTTRQDGRTTLYKRNERRRIDERIEELRTTHSKQDLIDGIQEMNATLQEFREAYDVDSPEDLAIELEPGDDGWGDVGRWRATRQNLAIAKAALQVDEAHRLAEA